MRRPRTLLALLALVALMATAGEQTTTYTSAPKPVKEVIKTQNRAKMLSPGESVSRKKAPSADQFQGLTFYANLTNSDSWAGVSIGSVPYGIYSYTIGSGADFQAHATDLRYDFMASAMGRDQLVGARPMQMMGVLNGVEYNGLSRADFSELWSMIYDYADYSFIPSVMAYDVTNDTFYSIQYNSDLTGLNLAKWNPIIRMFETQCAWPNRFQPMTLGITPEGYMFCVGSDGQFYHLDKETAEARPIFTLDVAPTMYVQSMGYEPRSACFLWMAVTQEGSALYAINPYEATMTLVEKLDKNEQAPAVFFMDNAAPAGAPAATTDLAFTFDGGSTDGTISFTVPTTTYGGAALSGDVTMCVWVDGEMIADYVSVAPGSRQTFDQQVSNDNHYVYVLFSNEGGNSPVNNLYVYAGYDTPLPVTNAVFTVENGVSHLTWDAPAGGVNNGYLADVTYSVVRMPGSVVVAEGLTECEFSETLPTKLERYYYIITPFNGDGKRGEEVRSNDVLTGNAFEAPYYDDFSDVDTRDLWTIVNANNDASQWGSEYTWSFNDYNQCWGIYTGPYNMGDDQDAADDYLVSPGIHIESGISYALIMNMRNTFANYQERVSLMVGTDPTDVSTFQVLDSNEAYDVGGTLADWEVDFQMEETGTYYFAVRVFTHREDNASGIFVYSMALNKLGLNGAPAEVTNLTVTPEESGEMIADVTFTVPTTTLNGAELTAPLTANIYRDGEETAVAQFPVEVGAEALWTDNTVEGVGVHTYTVGISNEAGEGKRVSAEAFIGVYTAPYTNAFDTEEDARFFVTVNDSASSGNEYRWIWYNYNQNLALGGYGYFVQHPVENIWLYMPAIKLEKDMVYTYAFNWTYSNYNKTCPGFAGIGMAMDPDAQSVYPDQLPFTDYGQKVWIENEVIAGETGKYYPSILITADQASSYISPSIDDISITLVGSAFAPYSVENLVVEHDMTGLLKVNFSFNAPSVDYAQRPLEGPLTVYIYREGSAIPLATFGNVEPGQALEWVDEQPLRGNNSYIIVAENEHGRGKVSTATVFAGVDVPLAVENFWIRGNEDNQKAVLTWDAPSAVGANGGVVDGSLTYTVVEYFPDGATPEEQMVVLGTTTETTFIVDREPTDEMEMHYYAVITSTSAGVGQAVLDDIILGKLKDIPFVESFSDAILSTTGWMTEGDVANYGTVWYILADDSEQTAQDGDNGFAMCYNGNYYSQYHWADLVSPKVKLDPDMQYTLSFYVYMGYPSSSAVLPTLVVSQSLNDDPYEELITIDVTEGEAGWQLFEIPLTGTQLANFAKICFRGYMSTMSERIWIDNVRITAVETPSAVNELTAKQQIVASKGAISVEGYEGQQVRVFTVDGRQVSNFVADGHSTLSMSPGIYIVTVGKQAFKVSVR